MNFSAMTMLVASVGDGPVCTAAAATPCLNDMCKYPYSGTDLKVGDVFYVEWQGRISCAATTPGTARFDLRMDSTVIWDSGAINLNTTAKTNVKFKLSGNLFVRQVLSGTTGAAAVIGLLDFDSEAILGSAAENASGGIAGLLVPIGAPANGSTWDPSTGHTWGSSFTQTVATGSMTVHNFMAAKLT
jgi:hypothetical protein